MGEASTAFETWGRAQAEANHHHHLAFRPQGAPTYGPADCADCKGWATTYGRFRQPFIAGWNAASTTEGQGD